MKKYLTLFVILLFAAGTFVHGKRNTGEPEVKEVLQLILANHKILLSADESCRSVGSSPSDKTVGDYLAGLLAFQVEPGTANKIEFSTKQADGPKGQKIWVNDVMFLGEEGETVQSYGIRISLFDTTRKFVKGSLQCIGAG